MLASIHELNVMYMHIGNHSHIVETVPLSKLVHYCKLPIHCIVETVTDLQEVWKGGKAGGQVQPCDASLRVPDLSWRS